MQLWWGGTRCAQTVVVKTVAPTTVVTPAEGLTAPVVPPMRDGWLDMAVMLDHVLLLLRVGPASPRDSSDSGMSGLKLFQTPDS